MHAERPALPKGWTYLSRAWVASSTRLAGQQLALAPSGKLAQDTGVRETAKSQGCGPSCVPCSGHGSARRSPPPAAVPLPRQRQAFARQNWKSHDKSGRHVPPITTGLSRRRPRHRGQGNSPPRPRGSPSPPDGWTRAPDGPGSCSAAMAAEVPPAGRTRNSLQTLSGCRRLTQPDMAMQPEPSATPKAALPAESAAEALWVCCTKSSLRGQAGCPARPPPEAAMRLGRSAAPKAALPEESAAQAHWGARTQS